MSAVREWVGWYLVPKDHIYRTGYECAAWYTDVLVKAGRYPIMRTGTGRSASYSAKLPGTCVAEDFTPLWGGVPIGPSRQDGVGQPATYVAFAVNDFYLFLDNPTSPWEFFPWLVSVRTSFSTSYENRQRVLFYAARPAPHLYATTRYFRLRHWESWHPVPTKFLPPARMSTGIRGEPAEWTREIWEKWNRLECWRLFDGTITAANFFTPRPCRNIFDRGSDAEGFTVTVRSNETVEVHTLSRDPDRRKAERRALRGGRRWSGRFSAKRDPAASERRDFGKRRLGPDDRRQP